MPPRQRPSLTGLGLMLGLLLIAQGGCSSVGYVLQQGLGQLALLRSRQRVSDVIANPATPEFLRERLRLAMDARRFGIEVLGLRGGAEFTRFVDTHGPVAYSVSAARKTELLPVTWRFPLIGTVPYLGFFAKKAAQAEVRKLQRQGYDTYARSVSGFSTLGYFLSPVYASMVSEPGQRGELRTVEVILHEMAHTTAYVTSASDLNESFATLVGVQGAALYFLKNGNPESGKEVLLDAMEQERQAQAFSAWLSPVLSDLKELYRQARSEHAPEQEIVRRRQAFFAKAMDSYRERFAPGQRYQVLAEGPINNAVLLAFGVYHSSAHVQELLLSSVRGDLLAFVELYRQAAARRDGAVWLRRLAAEQAARSGEPADSPD